MLKKIRSVVCYVIYGSLTALAISDAQALETGLASYYSDKFQGHRTASGVKYDRNKLTAAHRSLPIGSKIEVTNLKNQNSVIVTINDRGPFGGHRQLDLSYAAAKEIGLVAMGVAPVSYELVTPDKNDRDFEQVIPREYTPGVLEVAKSEEELIEAEEEVVSPESEAAMAVNLAEEQKNNPPSHLHKKKKITASEKEAHSSKKEAQLSKKDLHSNKSQKHSISHSEKDSKTKTSAHTHEQKAKPAKAKVDNKPKKTPHKKRND